MVRYLSQRGDETTRMASIIHAVRDVWLFSSAQPDAYVDISVGFERKIAARLAHDSQTHDAEAVRAGWRERATRIGAEAGLPLAEAFVKLHLD